jgi:type I restriction enzyme S subunit
MRNNLERNWQEVQLIELLETLESGSRPKGGVRGILDGVPSLGAEHINDTGAFKFTKIKYVPRSFAQGMSRGKIKKGDILIVKDGATTGKTSFVGDDFPYDLAFVNEHVFICRPTKLVESKYVYWYLRSQQGNSRLMENFKGSAQGGINQTFASNVLIPLVPYLEQKRIVAKLDELIGKIDINRAHLERIPQVLNRLRQSILSSATSGKLTKAWRTRNDIKDTWANKNLKDVIIDKPKNGFSARPVSHKTNFKVLSLSATTSGQFVSDHFKYFEEPIAQDSQFWLQPDDILIQRGNTLEYVGVPAIYDGPPNEFIYPDLMMRLRVNQSVTTKFLYYTLSDEKTRNYLRGRATGTSGTMPKINQPTLMGLPIAVPTLGEQNEIVERVERLFNITKQIEGRYNQAKEHFDKLTQSCLSKAFLGELSSQNQNDEPVVALLERIKTQLDNKHPKSIPKKRQQKSIVMELYEILKKAELPLPPKEVWKMSRFNNDIEAFYSELRREIKTLKRIKESKDKKYLELVK